MKKIYEINLQLFADASEGNVNATTTGSLSPEVKTFYDKKLIKVATANLCHAQFGQKRPIPKGRGKDIEFRRFASLGRRVSPLQEGITPTGDSLSVTSKTATVYQFGNYVTLSDVINLTAIDPMVDEAVEVLGNQAASNWDWVIRTNLISGTNVQYGDGTVGGRSALVGGQESGNHYMSVDVLRRAARTLKAKNTPKIDGYYIAIMHPSVAYDLMSDPEWIDAQKHTSENVGKLYRGEIGCIAGVRVIESTEAAIVQAGESERTVYATLVFGKDAYGVTELEGGGLQTFVKSLGSGGTSDPLDQRSTVGWKFTGTATILVDEYLVRVETTSSFNDSFN